MAHFLPVFGLARLRARLVVLGVARLGRAAAYRLRELVGGAVTARVLRAIQQ